MMDSSIISEGFSGLGTVVISSGKSFTTSAISLPRSPQPTYTTASLLENFDRDWEITVLPQPNAPGTAQVPPSTEGNTASSTRCPVIRGLFAASFSATGRGDRTGQSCFSMRLYSSPSTPSTTQMVSKTL